MKSSLKITLIYLTLSFFWILFSDKFLLSLTSETDSLTRLQTYKGWFFIFTTSVFLFLLINAEIKKLNRVKQELVKAKEKAEESDRLKTAFLSNMSHEIRTPLNGILGFSNLLCEEEISIQNRELYQDQINSNSQLLLKIINDIIEISKIQENMLQIQIKRLDLNLLFENLYQGYNCPESILTKKGLELKLIPENKTEPFIITSDPERLLQVLGNLIDNAVKFTQSGTISIGYKTSGEKVNLFVEDTGIGISKENQKQIFERFKQTSMTRDRNAGFGLGLSISKGISEALGGRIFLESEPGKGSRFTVELPAHLQSDSILR